MAIIRLIKEWPNEDTFPICGRCGLPVTAEAAYWYEMTYSHFIICECCAKHLEAKAWIRALMGLIETGVVKLE